MAQLADVDLLLRFIPKTGKSIAVAKDEDDIENKTIFLPLSEIEIHETGRYEGGLKIITVTMPQWLAEEKELV